VSPQHETDDAAERECRSERRDRAIRNKILDLAFFLAQGLAEIVQCCLDPICERLGAVEASKIPSLVVFNRRDTSPLSACSSFLSSLESNIGLTFVA
jgi:hypothetical protein